MKKVYCVHTEHLNAPKMPSGRVGYSNPILDKLLQTPQNQRTFQVCNQDG